MKLFHVAAAVLVALVLAAIIGPYAGLGLPNAQVLGIPLGPQTVPRPANDWKDCLRAAADAHTLEAWQIDQFTADLSYSANKQQCYYRATLNGTRDGEPVTAKVELQAANGQEWQLSKWSEAK